MFFAIFIFSIKLLIKEQGIQEKEMIMKIFSVIKKDIIQKKGEFINGNDACVSFK